MIGVVAEFERAMILEQQREGIALARAAGKYKGRKPSLNPAQIREVMERSAKGECKSQLAREYGICRETHYSYLRDARKAA